MGPNRIVSLRGSGAAEVTSYYHSDHLGSSNVTTNKAGNLVSNSEYLPYGEFSTNDGTRPTNYCFTGKELDDETGLYFYGARYYDPQIGRFIQPDTIVPHPYNPQSLNRYSYCYNNPINLTDPTGHWPKWKNIWQTVVSVITGVVSILCPVLAPVMWVVNMAISAYTAVQTGSILGFAGGIVGGAVFGALGKSLSLGLAGMMSAEFSKTFIGGALIGAVEFGMGGFGAGFGASVASGRSLSDSMRAGAIGAAMGAVTGAIIEGSYRAGWQNKLHGASNDEIAVAQSKNNVRVMKGQIGIHGGIEIRGTGEYDGRWGFNPDSESSEYSKVGIIFGKDVPGKIYSNNTGEKPYWFTTTVSTDRNYARNVYNAIQADMSSTNQVYNLYTDDCYQWRNAIFIEAKYK